MATEPNGSILLEPPETRDGLTVVSTLPHEGDIPHFSTELNNESKQISPIKTTVSDIEDMQISPIQTTVSDKEDMQISPMKTTVSEKEEEMQISPMKTTVSDKQISPIKTSVSDKEDDMQISAIKTTVPNKEDVMRISTAKTTVSDTEDVNLIRLKHPDTAIDSNPDDELPEIVMQQDILTGGNTKGISSLCSDDKDEEEDHIGHVAKKLKTGKDTKSERRSVDAAIKQTSEIVLVLAGMGQMRAGRSPTDFERGLMTEAWQKLGYLAGKLAPKDLVSKHAVESMIEDLGLNSVKDPTKVAGPKKINSGKSIGNHEKD